MSDDNLRPAYDDDQMDNEAYKRGAQHKWTKARKADYDGKSTSNEDEHVEKRAYVCQGALNTVIGITGTNKELLQKT